jgi:hypothetical protein
MLSLGFLPHLFQSLFHSHPKSDAIHSTRSFHLIENATQFWRQRVNLPDHTASHFTTKQKVKLELSL